MSARAQHSPSTTPDREEDESSLAREDIFHILSNERRQHILNYLKVHNDQPVKLRELVDHVTAEENNVEISEIDTGQRKAVYSALKQTHLPTLYKCGLIKYDSTCGIVELTDDAQTVQMYLEYVPENDLPWSYFYLGLTAVLSTMTILSWLNIYPFGLLSGMALATMIVLIFAVFTSVHTLQTKRNKVGTSIGSRKNQRLFQSYSDDR